MGGTLKPELKARKIVAALQKDLSLGDLSNVLYNLTLPTQAAQDTTISWESSRPEHISVTGEVYRPEAVYSSSRFMRVRIKACLPNQHCL